MAVTRQSFYNSALAQAFSPCGHYLAVGDFYGVVSIFHISKVVQSETALTRDELCAKHKITVKEDYQINSLITVEDTLIIGGVGKIHGYAWKNLKSSSKTKNAIWTIEIPNQQDDFETKDVNCLAYNEESGSLFGGCGDDKIYEFNLETRRLVKTLGYHSGYIHSVVIQNGDLISGGEDGVINIADLRTGKVSNKFMPYKYDNIARPSVGRWIGAISSNEDFILCGGGPRLSQWHYRFLSPSTIFPVDDNGIQVAEIYKDKVLAGGRARFFYRMSLLGDIVAEIPTSAVTIYSAIHQEEPNKILCLAGSSSKVEICSDFMYKNQHLYL